MTYMPGVKSKLILSVPIRTVIGILTIAAAAPGATIVISIIDSVVRDYVRIRQVNIKMDNVVSGTASTLVQDVHQGASIRAARFIAGAATAAGQLFNTICIQDI